MRKGLGTWLATSFVLGMILSPGMFAQGGKFSDYAIEETPQAQPKREDYIILDVKDKDLREVLKAISRKVGVNIVADPNVDEKVTVTLDRVEWRFALDIIARQTNCRIVEESSRLIRLTQPPTISMEFQDADLKIVLDLVAKQSGSNIVIAENVKGNVSLSLREVPWEEALQTIVKTAGFAIVEDVLPSSGTKILRVVTPESLVQQLEACFIQLKYVRPESEYRAIITNVQNQALSPFLDANGRARDTTKTTDEKKEFTLLAALRQILSQNGTIQYDQGTNSFYVKDTKPRIDEIRRIVAQIDREPPQIHVKVRFVTTANTDLYEKGLHFVDPGTGENTGDLASIQGAPPDSSWFLPPYRDEDGNNHAEYISNPLYYWGGTWPFDLGQWGQPVHGFHAMGILDLTRVQLLLSMIEQDENSRIVQAPELTTMDGKSATIFVGESIPFAEQAVSYDQNGNVTVSLKENQRSPVSVGFTLYLTPHVVPGTDEVDLSVIPKISTLTGKSSPLDGFDRFNFGETYIDLPRESAQTVVTSMRVQQSHTAVIGGLQTESRTSVRTRVPLLSSIPILGHLFTYTKDNNRIQSILILISPTIIQNSDQGGKITQDAVDRLNKVDYRRRRPPEQGRLLLPEG
jgi:type IV pilus assembly protein PilQ